MSIKLKDTIFDYIDKAYKDSSGNIISSTYLPLSGGTISSSGWGAQLNIKRTVSSGDVVIGFFNDNGALGYIGFTTKDVPYFMSSAGSVKNLIHSGNIGSQSVNYASSAGNANTLDGIDSTGFLRYISHNATFTTVPTNLTEGMHKIHISNVECSSILTGYDFYGSYWQLYFHPSSGYSQDILYRASNCTSWKTLLDSNNSSVSGGGSSAGSSLTVKINGTTKTLTIPSSLPASDVYAWAKASTKPSYTYSEVGAPMHKYLFYKADYEHYVVLLCKIGTGTTNTNHRISGKIYTEAGGVSRYQAADIDVWRSDWSSGNDSYTKFNSYGLGEVWDLVTCKYGNSTYLAIRNRNTQACYAYFQGTATNIDFTAIKYYTSNTSTVNNSEINGSISVVSSFDRYAWKAEIPTKVSQLTNDSGYLTSLPSHNHDTLYVKYGKVAKSTADSTNANPYIYNIENETVISGYYAYWYILNLGQYSGGNFGTQIAMPYQDSLTDSELFIRSAKSGSWRTWRRVLHSNNYTEYTVKKDGTGASGTWGISVTGSSGSVAWGNVSGKPSTFTPSDHTHSYLPFEQTVNSKDINTIKTTGFYYGYNMTNSAITGISSFIVAKYSPDWGTQIQLCSETSRSYIRYWRNSGGIMGNWYTLAYTSDIPTKVSQLTNDSGYLTSLPSHTHSYLPLSGGTMTGNITVHTGADGCGLKFGTSTLNSLSNQLIWQSPEAIRFGSTSWDWNAWAGLKYNHSNKIIYLGLADNTIFNANSAQSGGKLYTPGVSSIHIGNGTYTVLHTGNWSSYCAASSHTHSYAGSNTSSGKAYDLYGHSGNPGSHNDVGVRWFILSSTSSGSAGYAGNNYGFPVSNNANGILWLGNHSGPYGGQLGISSNGRLYYRFISAGSFPTTANGGSWNRIAWESDLSSYVTVSGTQTISGKKTFSGGAAITNAPENTSMPYFLGIDAFADGGTIKYISKGSICSCIGAAPSSHTHSDYMVKNDPIANGTLRMDGSNSRGSFPAVKLHISGVNWSQMLMNGSGELEFRAGGSQDAAYVTTRMGACCCTTLYINGEQITFVT